MTYCLALNLNAGLVMLADSRTNAGVDNISTFGKLFTWSSAADSRMIGMMTAGNLSVTQEILSLIEEENAANGANQDGGLETILSAPSMFRVAQRVGNLMADVQGRWGARLSGAGVASSASILLAGRIGTGPAQLFLVYDAGNFIEATADTPFMQIGELKYGKPILDRVVTPHLPLEDGVKAAVLSMDATLRSNLSVGLPLDLAVLPTGAAEWRKRRIEAEDETYQAMSQGWGDHLRAGFQTLPMLTF